MARLVIKNGHQRELELTYHRTYHMWLLLVVYHTFMTLQLCVCTMFLLGPLQTTLKKCTDWSRVYAQDKAIFEAMVGTLDKMEKT